MLEEERGGGPEQRRGDKEWKQSDDEDTLGCSFKHSVLEVTVRLPPLTSTLAKDISSFGQHPFSGRN